uniref:Uncharacterized protein n=1 Tax=Oryza barthii TaxID=65489 RepID=A0A0D3G292_9ORYZ
MDDDDHDHHGNGNTLFSLALARSCGEVHLIGPACSLAQPSKAHWPTGSGRNRTGGKPSSSSSKTKTSLSLSHTPGAAFLHPTLSSSAAASSPTPNSLPSLLAKVSATTGAN